MTWLGIGVVSLPNGREHSRCHGWALVYHCPIIENIVNVMAGHWCSMIHCPMSGWALVYHCPMVENIVNVMVGHWCIIAQVIVMVGHWCSIIAKYLMLMICNSG